MVLGQTVTVVNKSGKVVSTGKHLVNVFKEAKSAYQGRKAEINAIRDAEEVERKARKAMTKLAIEDDNASRASSRRSHKSSRSRKSHRDAPPMARGYSDSFYANEQPRAPRSTRQSALRHEYDADGEIKRNELVRRHTDGGRQLDRPKTSRSASVGDIDMDLAYGDIPPPLPERHGNEEVELRSKMLNLQSLLDEANCMQHSVVTMIDNLQKNPDALAAVALTLGEISTIASKLAPGALMSLKGAFPAVIALLLSPEFMIAAGVGLGVTVIMLGGYKIIKRVQRQKQEKLIEEDSQAESESVSEYDELREIDSELSRIELWRRGIADAEAEAGPGSLGTSVDGEFITPGANKYLIEEGVIQEDLKSTKSGKTSKSKKSKRESSTRDKEKAKKERSKKKEPSGLRMLFKAR